jgi:hypothetical protein
MYSNLDFPLKEDNNEEEVGGGADLHGKSSQEVILLSLSKMHVLTGSCKTVVWVRSNLASTCKIKQDLCLARSWLGKIGRAICIIYVPRFFDFFLVQSDKI